MKFVNEYHKMIDQLRKEQRNLEYENEKAQERIEEINKSYQEAVTNLDFDGANEYKRQIKEIETAQETRDDMIKTLNKKIVFGDVDAAKKAAKQYHEMKQEHVKKRDKLVKDVIKKRDEYLSVLDKVVDYNVFLEKGTHEFSEIRKVLSKLNSKETREELGFNPFSLTNKDPNLIDYKDLLIGSVAQVKNLTESNKK